MRKQTCCLIFILILITACNQKPNPTPISVNEPISPHPSPTSAENIKPRQERKIGSYQVSIWDQETGIPSFVDAPDHYGYYGTLTITHDKAAPIIFDGVTTFYDLPVIDLTGEGNPDVMIRTRNGGSHCCGGVILYDLGEQPREVLMISGGFGSMEGSWLDAEPFHDLDGDGIYEIIGRESVDLDCTVPQAKIILKFENGRYYNIGALYPEQYQDEIKTFRERIEKAATDAFPYCALAELMLTYIYSGQEELGWAVVQQRYPETELGTLRADLATAVSDPNLFLNVTP